jgi:hypothetical protein
MKLHSTYYIQTFASPQQLSLVFETLITAHGEQWSDGFDEVVVVDCSTDVQDIKKNAAICEQYNARHIAEKINYGISGGRQRMAELFLRSDSEYAFQQGDGLLWCEKGSAVDKFGLVSHVDGLFTKAKKIMSYERLDYLVLTYSQKFATATKWYPWLQLTNTERLLSDFSHTPMTKDCPRTKFSEIATMSGLPYALGHIPYTNWPSVWSRRFASDLILNKLLGKAHENKWMRALYFEHDIWKLGVVLASPLRYHHKFDYNRKLRIETR